MEHRRIDVHQHLVPRPYAGRARDRCRGGVDLDARRATRAGIDRDNAAALLPRLVTTRG